MSYLVAFLIVLTAVLVAVAVSRLAGGWLSMDQRRRHHEVGGPVFSQLGVMISILLAFVFTDVWGEYGTAAEAINTECGALHGAAMLAKALPQSAGEPLVTALDAYARLVVSPEWAAMSRRHRSPEARAAFEVVFERAERLDATGAAGAGTQSQILTLISDAHSARETRMFEMTEALQPFLWAMLISLSVVLVMFVSFAGVEEPARTVFVAVFAGSIALVLVAVRMLDYPFEGALALRSTDFIVLVGELDRLAAAAPGSARPLG